MLLRSAFSNSKALAVILCLSLSSITNAYPIITSDIRGASSTLALRSAAEGKEAVLISRNQIYPGSKRHIGQTTPVDSLTGNPNLTQAKQRDQVTPSDVIPKDPNGFFHPASLRRFKSSVASFKAWQHLHILPDANTLAHTKAQEAASELDYFIEKISAQHHPARWDRRPYMPL